MNSVLFIASLFIIAAIGYVDHITGTKITLSLVYIIPMAIVSWYIGKWSGIMISVITNCVELAVYLSSQSSIINPGIELWNFTGRLSFFVIIAYLISYVKKLLESERNLARVDHLTGINNSRSFYELVHIEFERSRRSGGPLTIAYLDLDNFKSVNDTLGHLAGDNLLQVIAQTIKKSLRVTDSVARIGGDEFVLLLTMDDYDQANTALRRILGILIEHMTNNTWPVTFSIGAVTCHAPTDSPEAVIKIADSLIYEVKQSGKNNIRHIVV